MKMNVGVYIAFVILSFFIFVFNSTFGTIIKSPSDVNDNRCQNGELYQTYSPVNMSRDDINNIKFVNASSLDTLTIIVMKQPSNCCTEVMLHDCISGLDYNLTTCKRRAFHLNITDTVLIPGDAYILNFKRNDTCIDRVIIVMKRKDKIRQTYITSSTTGEHISHIHPTTSTFTGYTQGLPDHSGLFSNKVDPLSNGKFNFYTTGLETSPEHKQLYSSLDTTISTTGTEFTRATTVLQTVHPLNSSLNTFSMIPSVALMPTNVNHTLQDSFTTFSLKVPHSDYTDSKTTIVVDEGEQKDSDKPDSTIALGVTISLFAVAVIIICILIIRLLYKTRKDIHIKSDNTSVVFCSNDFFHTAEFVNEVPTAVTKPDFINIRKVSDSNTDEMTEIEDKRYNNTTYGDSMYLGGDNSSPNRNNIGSKYGLTVMKKYPAPQPNKSSSYDVKSPRCTTFKSEANYFQYNKH